MQVSFNGLEILKEHEGFRAEAYKDTGGVWTIGYGTTRVDSKPVIQGMKCTNAQALEWLRADTSSTQTAINQLVRVPINQNQFDALVSFVYNVGEDRFRKSTLLRLLNAGDYTGAANQFPRWNKDNGKVIPGLVSRRLVEQSMFNT
jgi:lysozyme